MKRRVVAAFLLAGSLCLAGASADLPEKWRSWRYSRALLGNPAEADVRAELSLPWEIFLRCAPGCDDVRIVNTLGEEVSYLVEQQHAAPIAESHAVRIVENSFVARQYTQVIGDLGAERQIFFDRVKVETSRSDFIVWAEVALSDDARTWRVVEARAPIARFRSRSIEGTQAIPFQGLSSRYVRVRIADPSAQFPVDALSVLSQASYKFQTKEVPAAFAEEKSADPTESIWQATLASSNQPVSELRLSTDAAEFYRALRISGSNDGRQWSYSGSGIVYRYSQGGKARESLVVQFPECSGFRFIRAELINGNDQALGNARFTLAAPPRTLALKYSAGQQYRLIYGNEKALRPQYDLAHYFDFGPPKPAYAILSLGPEEASTNYRDPRPFTERHPEVLWTALALAIVLIGLTAIRTLRGGSKPAENA